MSLFVDALKRKKDPGLLGGGVMAGSFYNTTNFQKEPIVCTVPRCDVSTVPAMGPRSEA